MYRRMGKKRTKDYRTLRELFEPRLRVQREVFRAARRNLRTELRGR